MATRGEARGEALAGAQCEAQHAEGETTCRQHQHQHQHPRLEHASRLLHAGNMSTHTLETAAGGAAAGREGEQSRVILEGREGNPL